MAPNIRLQVNDQLCLKDPLSSELGVKIISSSIDLIDSLGFEQFTFGKLSKKIESTEASVYRYFGSKHMLLLYLCSWYWAWMEYRLHFAIANIETPQAKLDRALSTLLEPVDEDTSFTHINEVKLYRIVISESSKAYLTKEVDSVNAQGAFLAYKNVVGFMAGLVLEINKTYKYPHMLMSTVIEGALHERFFSEHLPRLTDTLQGEDAVILFYKELVQRAIK